MLPCMRELLDSDMVGDTMLVMRALITTRDQVDEMIELMKMGTGYV